MYRKKHNAGFTMIEVLITLIILSLGLLGLAGMQATGLKSNHEAYMRSQATLLAYDMSDRMRANMAGVSAGNYNNISGIPQSYTDCESNACTPAQMAVFDTYQWNTALADKLPSGQGTVTTSGGISTLSVMWDHERSGASGTDCDPDDADDLKCFQVELEL
jgi:type IV pilus assembly protein PilV